MQKSFSLDALDPAELRFLKCGTYDFDCEFDAREVTCRVEALAHDQWDRYICVKGGCYSKLSAKSRLRSSSSCQDCNLDCSRVVRIDLYHDIRHVASYHRRNAPCNLIIHRFECSFSALKEALTCEAMPDELCTDASVQ